MLTRMVSISWSHDLPASASQSAGITGMSHRTQPEIVIFDYDHHCILLGVNYHYIINHNLLFGVVILKL